MAKKIESRTKTATKRKPKTTAKPAAKPTKDQQTAARVRELRRDLMQATAGLVAGLRHNAPIGPYLDASRVLESLRHVANYLDPRDLTLTEIEQGKREVAS